MTMYAELKRVHSPDVEDLENYVPSVIDNFGFLLQIEVGPKGSQSADTFDVMVCTPQWLKQRYKPTDILHPSNYLILFEYDYKRLVNFITKYCTRCSGETWEEIARQLSRLGHWEFTDFRPVADS